MNYQLLILFLVYIAIIASLGYFRFRGRYSKYLLRKSVHLLTGLAIFYLSFKVPGQTLLLILIAGTLFSFVSYFIKKVNFIHMTGNSSWGTLFYPLGILSAFLVLYDLPIYYFQISLLFLTVSDTMANVGGQLIYRNPQFAILSEKKTPLGILLFAATAFLTASWLLPGSIEGSLSFILLTLVCAVHFEIISYKGSDNLAIPLGTAIFFYITHDRDIDPIWLSGVIAGMGLVSIFIYRMGILTRNGSIGAHLLGIYLLGILGIEWALPVVFFFLSSVIFTRINDRVTHKSQGFGKRNIWQVMANILAAILFSAWFLINRDPLFTFFFLSVIAAVTADTWASEIGPVFQKKCFSLSKMRMDTAGISGGISIAGTLASLSGSFLVSLLGMVSLMENLDALPLIFLTLSGFLASLVDSLLGAFVEPRMEKMRIFRKRGKSHGISPNDLINFAASLSAPIFFLIFNTK